MLTDAVLALLREHQRIDYDKPDEQAMRQNLANMTRFVEALASTENLDGELAQSALAYLRAASSRQVTENLYENAVGEVVGVLMAVEPRLVYPLGAVL